MDTKIPRTTPTEDHRDSTAGKINMEVMLKGATLSGKADISSTTLSEP